jgi:hypothetical protein
MTHLSSAGPRSVDDRFLESFLMPPAALQAMQRHGQETIRQGQVMQETRLFAAIALCGEAAAPLASLAAGADCRVASCGPSASLIGCLLPRCNANANYRQFQISVEGTLT